MSLMMDFKIPSLTSSDWLQIKTETNNIYKNFITIELWTILIIFISVLQWNLMSADRLLNSLLNIVHIGNVRTHAYQTTHITVVSQLYITISIPGFIFKIYM